MSYEKSYAQAWAQIQGITLLENMLKHLARQLESITTISGDWAKKGILNIKQQVELIDDVSADDIASKYLVFRINKLNDEIMSEFPYKGYALKLTKKCIYACQRAIQAHSHIWNIAQLQAVLTALGSSHIVKTKGSPYYLSEKEKKKGEEKKEPYFLDVNNV